MVELWNWYNYYTKDKWTDKSDQWKKETSKKTSSSVFDTDSSFIKYKPNNDTKNPFDTKYWSIAEKRKATDKERYEKRVAEVNAIKETARLKREEIKRQNEDYAEQVRLEAERIKEEINIKNEDKRFIEVVDDKIELNLEIKKDTLEIKKITKYLKQKYKREEQNKPLTKKHKEKYDNFLSKESNISEYLSEKWREYNKKVLKIIEATSLEDYLKQFNEKNNPKPILKKNNISKELPKKENFIKYEKRFEVSSRWKRILSVLDKAVKDWNSLWAKNCSDFADKAYKLANNGRWIYDFPNTFNWVDYKPNSWKWTWLLVEKYASNEDVSKLTPGSHIIIDLKDGDNYWEWKTHSIIAKSFPSNWKIEAYSFPATWNKPPTIAFYDTTHILRIQAA